MRLVIVVLDGLADIPYKELEGKTPLGAAYTPNLDFLAKKGKTGIMQPIQNIAPESDEAALTLLGYNPFEKHQGRGPLEALGANVDFSKEDVVLRCNYALHEGKLITNIEYSPSEGKIEKFEKELNKIGLGVEFKFKNTLGHRAVLILKGKDLSPKISNTHPGYEIVENYVTSAKPRHNPLKLKKAEPLNKSKKAKKTAEIVNKFVEKSKEVLGKNRIIITRGAGNKVPKLKKLKRKWGLFADTPVEMAIGKITGMEILDKPESVEEIAKKVGEALKKHDSLYLELKDPDHWAHKGDPLKKKEAIEEIDKEFVSKVMKLKNTVICFTADHATPCKFKAHSKHKVPLLLWSEEMENDGVKEFSEKACKKGSIGNIKGKNLTKNIQKELKD